MSKPKITIDRRDTKKAIATKVKRVLKKNEMYRELQLFNDFAPLCGPGKVGRIDMIDLALHYNVEVYKKQGKQTVLIRREDLK